MKIIKLEAVRGFAATYVVIHHLIGFTDLKQSMGPFLSFPFRFGQEAVILFFLMSGFVIALSMSRQTTPNFKSYFLKRFLRIYPFAIISFFISVIVLYMNGGSLIEKDIIALFGNLLMLQDTTNKPGSMVETFLDNHALWSLSYEWWFYMMFFPFFLWFGKIERIIPFPKIYIVLLLSAGAWVYYIFDPNHMALVVSYFVMWWSGVSCAEIYIKHKTFTFREMIPVFVSLSVMTLLMFIPVVIQYLEGKKNLSFIMYPVISLRHYAFALVSLLLAMVWWRWKMIKFDFVLKPCAKLAPISYALYIIHMPIIMLELPSITNIYIEAVLKLCFIFLTAYLLERKWQTVIINLFYRVKAQKRKERYQGLEQSSVARI